MVKVYIKKVGKNEYKYSFEKPPESGYTEVNLKVMKDGRGVKYLSINGQAYYPANQDSHKFMRAVEGEDPSQIGRYLISAPLHRVEWSRNKPDNIDIVKTNRNPSLHLPTIVLKRQSPTPDNPEKAERSIIYGNVTDWVNGDDESLPLEAKIHPYETMFRKFYRLQVSTNLLILKRSPFPIGLQTGKTRSGEEAVWVYFYDPVNRRVKYSVLKGKQGQHFLYELALRGGDISDSKVLYEAFEEVRRYAEFDKKPTLHDYPPTQKLPSPIESVATTLDMHFANLERNRKRKVPTR